MTKFPRRSRSPLLAALALLSASLAVPALGQDQTDSPKVYRGAEVIETAYPDLVEIDLRELVPARKWQPGDPIKEIPRRFVLRPELLKMEQLARDSVVPKVDPLLERQQSGGLQGVPKMQAQPGRFPGQGFSGVQPPDPVGDVGSQFYIQMINGAGGALVTVYNKVTTALVAGPINLDVLGTGFCANGLGDPIVLYDAIAGRWLLSEFSAAGNRLCVYVSVTGNPFQGFFAYQFQAPSFPDYPKYAVWPDAYYVSTNEAGGPAVYALERSQMLLGLPATQQRFVGPPLAGFGFQAFTPADLDGITLPPAGSAAYFMRHRDDEVHNPGASNPNADFLEIWRFSVNFANPALSSFTGPTNIAVTEFDSTLCGLFAFACFAQPGTPVTLDPLREVIMWRLQYRNFGGFELLNGNFVTDVNGQNQGGIRWFQLLMPPAGTWGVFNEGTYAPDSDNRWMGSSAMDNVGNFAVIYNVSSSATFPSLRGAARGLGAPPGTLSNEVTVVAGAASNPSNRYGDYSSMNIDSTDGCTFWFTGEYNPAAAWGTEIFFFRFNNCTGP